MGREVGVALPQSEAGKSSGETEQYVAELADMADQDAELIGRILKSGDQDEVYNLPPDKKLGSVTYWMQLAYKLEGLLPEDLQEVAHKARRIAEMLDSIRKRGVQGDTSQYSRIPREEFDSFRDMINSVASNRESIAA